MRERVQAMSGIPTGCAVVKLQGGGQVWVRRLGMGQQIRIAQAVQLSDSAHSQMAYGYMLVRAAICGAEGVTGIDGKAVEFKAERHPAAGPVCSEALADALGPVDHSAVIAAANGTLSQEQTGN